MMQEWYTVKMTIQANINTGEYDTLVAWSDIVIKMWQEKMMKLDVWETGQLYDSFTHTVLSQANGDIRKISFFFNVYGMWVNYGVGKEIARGNDGDLGFTPVRKRKVWHSKVFYREVEKILAYVNWKYGATSAEIIKKSMDFEGDGSIMEAIKKYDFSYWKKHFQG